MAFYSKTYSCFFISFLATSITALPFTNRIIGGESAKPGQFPFMVSFEVEMPKILFKGHYAGASILNSQWILTAAHCFTDPFAGDDYVIFDPSQISVLAGTNLLDTNGTRYYADKFFIHPNYTNSLIYDDVALIKIKGQIEFNDFVQPIEIGEVSANDLTTIIGWGAIDVQNQTVPNDLRYLEVLALSPEACDTLSKGSRLDGIPRGPGEVCIYRGVGQGACHGDSGGPMVFDGKLVGVTSYTLNEGCADGFPDVYDRPAFYKNWIQEIMDTN